MGNLNIPKNNVVLMPLKMCCCNKSINNVAMTKLKKHRKYKEIWNITLKLFAHVIYTYLKKPYTYVVKNI